MPTRTAEKNPPGSAQAPGLRGGLPVFGGRFTGTPNLGFGLADGGARDWRLGWRPTSAVRGNPGFEINLDATRREAANDDGPPSTGWCSESSIRMVGGGAGTSHWRL